MNYIQARTLECASYMLEHKCTIRQTAKHFNLAKSTVHSNIHMHLPLIDKNLYNKLSLLLNENYKEKHIRGGASTKLKYAKKQQVHL